MKPVELDFFKESDCGGLDSRRWPLAVMWDGGVTSAGWCNAFAAVGGSGAPLGRDTP